MRAIAIALLLCFGSATAQTAPQPAASPATAPALAGTDASGKPALRFVTTEPAPAIYRKLAWEQVDDKGLTLTRPVLGYFYTAEQVQRTAARIDYLEDKATKECITETTKGTTKLAPWIIGGVGLVAGLVGGYFLFRK